MWNVVLWIRKRNWVSLFHQRVEIRDFDETSAQWVLEYNELTNHNIQKINPIPTFIYIRLLKQTQKPLELKN